MNERREFCCHIALTEVENVFDPVSKTCVGVVAATLISATGTSGAGAVFCSALLCERKLPDPVNLSERRRDTICVSSIASLIVKPVNWLPSEYQGRSPL